MTDFATSERGVSIREPSTANLLIDSVDRTSGTESGDFLINKGQSILNGFFTRLGVVEVVLDWCVDNISNITQNSSLAVQTSTGTHLVQLDDGQYTVKGCLDALIAALNAVPGIGMTFSIYQNPAGFVDISGSAPFTILPGNLQQELNLTPDVSGGLFPVNCPVLLPYTYLDFVSNQLTYNQDLKDTTTNPIERNVLYRWYLAWDNEPSYDAYGYPILQGYKRFIQRRYIPFPKQIKWDARQPIGQLSFQVYNSQGNLMLRNQAFNGEIEWKMTCLVSEV